MLFVIAVVLWTLVIIMAVKKHSENKNNVQSVLPQTNYVTDAWLINYIINKGGKVDTIELEKYFVDFLKIQFNQILRDLAAQGIVTYGIDENLNEYVQVRGKNDYG